MFFKVTGTAILKDGVDCETIQRAGLCKPRQRMPCKRNGCEFFFHEIHVHRAVQAASPEIAANLTLPHRECMEWDEPPTVVEFPGHLLESGMLPEWALREIIT